MNQYDITKSREYLFNNSKLTVKFGNILDTQAEVIVSSDNCYVTMGGSVSKAILHAGGSTIINDAQKMVPVPLGDVIATTAGYLTSENAASSDIPVVNKDIVLPTRSTMKHQVFISYSRKDNNTADHLCEILKKNGIEYWIDKEGIYSSSNYKELIVDSIEVSQAVIFISSENSNASINVIREIGYAVNMNKPILPLIIDDAPYAKSIRLDISDIDQIDFRDPMVSSKKLITSLMYVVNK